MPAETLGEFGRIARFFRPLAAGFPGALNLTDDAAILNVPPGRELVVTTDAIVAGVHFLPTDSPGDIARKALRVNLSDLAAKGATPFAYTLTLAVGRDVDDGWIAAFAAGLAADQAEFGIALAGGDSVSTGGPVWASITAFGLVDAGRMVRRSGARPGDAVLVTGTIGDAALGLMVEQGRLMADTRSRAALVDRYRLPRPRTALAAAIGGHAHAAIDISDGLAADFGHLCRASQVIGRIEVSHIPLSPAARGAVAADAALMGRVLAGGDDYEVLLTAVPDAVPDLKSAAAGAGVALTEIGVIERAESSGGAHFLDPLGNRLVIEKAGWTHS
jgi:thiamine-monophosphate kinase